ncbi:hypothetical protein NQ314_016634, partial [Rhamnusium bicolor]
VQITESRPLKFVKTPPLRCGNDIRTQENATFLEPSSEIQMNLNTAIIKFHPDSKKQKKFGHYLEENISNGLSGQFVVQYDVERDPLDGEVLLRDGYFVHFFAPNDLDPLPKHVVFALDTSGSMGGRKIDQLKDAMMSILRFSRHIYEASDAALQLQEFYKQISSPLLSDIKFKYDSKWKKLQEHSFLFTLEDQSWLSVENIKLCSGLVHLTKHQKLMSSLHSIHISISDSLFPTCIDCFGPRGPIIIRSTIETLSSPIERLWAYLTVKQLLEERESVDDKTELTKKAVDLALKYSFVTDVTSLVVVKPNETNALNEACAAPEVSMAPVLMFGMTFSLK